MNFVASLFWDFYLANSVFCGSFLLPGPGLRQHPRTFIASCILTLGGPFNETGNGFFSTWASMYFIASYTFQIYGGGDFEVTRVLRRSLTMEEVEDGRAK